MRKEILFAILAGALFGLVIAFGVWKANNAVKPSGVSDTNDKVTSSTQPNQMGLTLSQPNEYEIFTSSETTVKGITQANSWINISGESHDYSLKADNNGSFEQIVGLASGVNEISVTSFNDDGDSTTEKIVVVFSSEFDKAETTKNE